MFAGSDGYVVIIVVLICLWFFVGVELVVVFFGMVENLKCMVLLVIMLGIGFVGFIYVLLI